MSFSFMEQENPVEFGENQNLLDEFLDQRVYETPNEATKMELMDENLGFDLDMSMYNTSPEWESANQTAFQSPEESSYASNNRLVGSVVTPDTGKNQMNYNDNNGINANDSAKAKVSQDFQSESFTGDYKIKEDLDSVQTKQEASNSLDDQLFKQNAGPISKDSDYDYARSRLSKLKFGNPNMEAAPRTTIPHPSYLDFSENVMAALPYKLNISKVPSYSRVETQIKINVSMSPPPPQYLLHIPQDLISKNKFCLEKPIETYSKELGDHILYLDTYVLTSDMQKSCTICPRCIKREQKRASRRKSGVYEEDDSPKNNTSWSNENMNKKAIIFNCKEVVSFPPPNGLTDSSKSLELSARIVCYCRHHQEQNGFKLLFVVKDYLGNVLAKDISTPIMIMDRKKTSNAQSNATMSVNNDVNSSNTMNSPNGMLQASSKQITKENSPMHPISPNSIDDLSEPTNTDTNDERGLKRKKLSVDDSSNTSNPMFNGINFSPISNSDTNASTHNYFPKPPTFGQQQQHHHQQQQQHQQFNMGPSIQRIIPAEGPIRGGIAVTLLGFNFRPGLKVKFGSNQALATHCWSETTIVTYLPPAQQPGQVLVSFESENMVSDQESIFTYTDDTDRQLIELALQIVGLKMNGKLEDAKNIARRIVGTDTGSMTGNNNSTNMNVGNSNQHSNQQEFDQTENSDSWFDEAHRTVKELAKSDLSSEDLLISLLSLVDSPNCPLTLLNWSLSNHEGQSLLHLASLKNYTSLVRFLMTRGSKIDIPDNQGLTPLFYASLCGHRDLINIFVDCRANYNLRLSNDLHLTDYCDSNVMDIFSDLSEVEDSGCIGKSKSVDSLYSIFARSYGKHISKMVHEDTPQISKHTNQDSSEGYEEESEFADSEGESDSDLEADDEGEDDLEDEINEEETIIPTDAAAIATTTIWQRVKNVFNNDEDEMELPLYDELFPFGHTAKPEILEIDSSSTQQPVSDKIREITVTSTSSELTSTVHEEDAVTSDSSDDIVLSRKFQERRKTVKNDKMLLFFWFPVLIMISSIFVISSMGYKFAFIENLKDIVRVSLGNLMLGNERLIRVFKPELLAT